MATENKKEEPKVTCYEDEENLKKLCDFLRSSDGPAVREALLMEKRVYYLKGRSIGFWWSSDHIGQCTKTNTSLILSIISIRLH